MTCTPRLSIAVGRARPTAARANSNYRQSDDGRPVDALGTASGQGLTENRQDHGSEAVQSQAGDRLAGNCNDGEEAATGRYRRLAIVAGRLRRRALVVVLMGGAVSMDVKVAAMVVLGGVIVNADVTFGQAMCDGRIVGKRKGDRRRENAKRVERGNDGRRSGAKTFSQDRQHFGSRALNPRGSIASEHRILTLLCNDSWATMWPSQRRMRWLKTRPRTSAATQPKTTLKTMPSIQTRTDVIGATENRPIHPCEARHSGNTSATARQITNRTTSAAERPHPRATMFRGLYVDVCVFIECSFV